MRAWAWVLLLSTLAAAPVDAQQPYQPYAPPPQQQPLPQFNVWSLLNQSRSQIQQANPQKALECAQQFSNMRPLEPEGYFWQGVSYDNLMQTTLAVQAYETGVQRVIHAGMDSAELRMNLGNDLLKLNRIDDAISQYRRAVQIDPQLPLAHLNLGRALVEKGDIDEALDCFQRCEDLRFKPSQLAYYRAKAMIRAGRVADAKVQLQSTLSSLNETSPVSQKLKQEFSSVLGEPQPNATTSGGTQF